MQDTISMAPNMHHSLFMTSHLAYLHTELENYMSYMDIQHIKRLLYYQRDSLCGLELHERSDWRATAPDTHQSFSDTTLHGHILQAHCLVRIYA